ncbi:MAG: MFS transporter, partial [Bacteroidales bacterium]
MAKIPKNILATGLTSFLTDTSTKMLYSVMPVFLLSMGASKTTISLIEGIAESTASLLKAFSGLWSDKLGKKKPFMIIGYGLTALITPLYALATIPIHVLVFRFIERIGKGLRAAPRDSLISASTTKGESGKNFGFQKAMDNSGAILGPLMAFLLLSIVNISFKNLFLLSAIPAFFGVMSIILLVKEAPAKTTLPVVPVCDRPARKNIFIQLPKRFWYFLAVVFLFSLGNSTDALLLVKTVESGVKQ